jgi:hypothetical protein
MERCKERKTDCAAEARCPGGDLMVSYYVPEKKRITVFYGKMEVCGKACFARLSKNLLE